MPLEKRFIIGDILDPDSTNTLSDINNLVDHQKWITMRDHALNSRQIGLPKFRVGCLARHPMSR